MKKFTLLLLTMAMMGVGCLGGRTTYHVPRTTSTDESMAAASNENSVEGVKIEIEGNTYNIKYHDGMSVYEAMMDASSTQGFKFDGKDYGGEMGYFVTSISGKSGDAQNNLYWVFYINDKKAQSGISSTKLNANDVITWKYEPLQF